MGYAGQDDFTSEIYILSHGDNVSAGSDSKSNQPHKELADRTTYLKNFVENDLKIEDLATDAAILERIILVIP